MSKEANEQLGESRERVGQSSATDGAVPGVAISSPYFYLYYVHHVARGDHPPVSPGASRAHRGCRTCCARWIELSEGNPTSPLGESSRVMRR